MSQVLPWIILLLPLAAAAVITLWTRRNARVSAGLSIGAILVGFCLSLLLYFNVTHSGGESRTAFNWLSVGALRVDLGLQLDPLSLLMLLIVTGVGGVIHVYSAGYMRGDPGYARYFACLSLFTFSMLGIVLADNFFMMFIFWELVGVSSYLLIGFWYERRSAADACKKAFLTNRVGDFGFLLGIIIVWAVLGSLNFAELKADIAGDPTGALGAVATAAGLLIFCGAAGKSAQFPLHVWLPDAMEGPTPVSALIHAATMVAAGVYMLCRVLFLFTPAALEVIGWVGGITALLAALIAVQQNDIKRILAYSTLSQLGYMVLAVGVASGTGAMFHLVTHAFFKALLFLGAGSVIHALHHEQDIWRMGGLRRRMPATYRTFLIGTLALCGVPPLSGFYSKDGILAAAAERSPALFALATLVAVLTAFYMFRLVFVAFLGSPRTEAAGQAHESPGVMVWPLWVLAFGSVFAGFWGIDLYLRGFFEPGRELHALTWHAHLLEPFNHSPLAALFGLFAVAIGFSAARACYAGAEKDPLPARLPLLTRVVRERFYLDEIYAALIAGTQDALARLADWLDRHVVAGFLVRGSHGSTEFAGRALRLLQTGNLQTYAFLLAAGVVLLLYFVLGG